MVTSTWFKIILKYVQIIWNQQIVATDFRLILLDHITLCDFRLLDGKPGFDLEPRGEVEIKGKGKMRTYFVTRGDKNSKKTARVVPDIVEGGEGKRVKLNGAGPRN